MHGYHRRTVTDVSVDGRQVVAYLRARRLVYPVPSTNPPRADPRTAEAASAPHGTACLADSPGDKGVMQPGRRHTTPAVPASAAPRCAICDVWPQPAVPRVIAVDELVLPRLRRYATIITDTEPGRRVAVPPDCAMARPGVLAARTFRVRGRAPGRLGHLCRGPPRPARRGAGQRPTAPLAQALRRSPARGPRARRLLGDRERCNKSTIYSTTASACATAPAASAWP
ncbi:hypothetical protein ACH4NC_02410 [Streptomyces sp. NPDC017201]|uniref:hypothetical protein n=1 Tax=Streptomyces sp. NPDC017201 TaxID=3364980 RepID=UPI00378BE7D8